MRSFFLPSVSGDTFSVLLGSPWALLIGWLALANLAAFCLMWSDKRRAKRDKWRIPEKTLFLSALLGGSVGAILGMRVFHHKTKHWYFVWGMPLILIAQLALAGFVWYKFFF